MRGKGWSKSPQNSPPGITPAYAGKSMLILCKLQEKQDHPRLCGEKESHFFSSSLDLGSPPPMRGKVVDLVQSSTAI